MRAYCMHLNYAQKTYLYAVKPAHLMKYAKLVIKNKTNTKEPSACLFPHSQYKSR